MKLAPAELGENFFALIFFPLHTLQFPLLVSLSLLLTLRLARKRLVADW